MKCPECGNKMGVEGTRTSPGNNVYRRRACQNCGYSFFTVEQMIEDTPRFRELWNKIKPQVDNSRKKERLEKRIAYLKSIGVEVDG